jgi:hypothetical protein
VINFQVGDILNVVAVLRVNLKLNKRGVLCELEKFANGLKNSEGSGR